MAPPQIAEQQPFLDVNDFLHPTSAAATNTYNYNNNDTSLDFSTNASRRYSQSHVASLTSSVKDGLTIPYTRSRSFSTSAVHGSLAAQFIASVNEKLKNAASEEEKENADETTTFLDSVTHTIYDTTREIERALLLGSKRLLLIEELPKDRQENQYVLSGYRFYRSTKDCLKSLFKIHNETMNIWSHLLGFFFFSYLSVSVFQVCLS